MSAPSQAYTDQLVKVQSGERLATTPEPNSAPGGVICRREARGRGYRAATQVKGLSPEMLHRSGSRQFSYARKAIIAYPFWQGYVSPAGSETVARYQREGMGTREARYAPNEVCTTKLNKGKAAQMAYRDSDQFIVAMKQGNSWGAKGLAVESKGIGETFAVLRDGEREITEPISETCCIGGGENLLKSRMREICTSGSVRGFVVSSCVNSNHGRWL